MRFRMTRDQFAQAMARPQRKPTILETARLMAIQARQAMVKDGLISPKKKTAWRLKDGNNVSGEVVFAHTKSEARSEFKKIIGITKRRLPLGMTVVKAECAGD